MHLTGKHSFQASNDTLWNLLMDADVLARITPGVSKLEHITGDQYKATAYVKMGPVSGSFSGKMEVAEKSEPESFVLKVKQNSRIGNVSADVKIHLKPVSNNETEMAFEGDARLSGLLARTGNRVLSGVANTLTKQFFNALVKEVASMKKTES
jgi:carbon monoxide dehydrogenase subunit G